MVLSSDQGTVVSVDGAKTWSTWYNQPTAQIYHVAADNRFPYWLYGAQQDSGGVGVSTWSREGVLSFRNWEPTCLAGESNTVVPDPKDGNILYGSGAGRCDQALQHRRVAGRAVACRPIPTIPTARPGRCRKSSRRPTKRSTTPISSSSARATAATPGKRSAPTWRALNPRRARHARPAHRQRYRRGDDRPLRRGLHHRPLAARRPPPSGWAPTTA